MVRLIALDLDETLLNRDSALSPDNRAALERALSMGMEIVVATGRAWDTIPGEILEFPGLRYAVTGNGAAIYDLTDGHAIRRQTLPEGAAAAVLRAMEGLDIAYEIFVDGIAYAQADYLRRLDRYMMDGHRQDYVLSTRRPVPDIRDFILAHQRELDSMAVIPADLDARARAMKELERIPGVYVTSSHVRLIEINHRDCTKAAGLRFLANMLGIPQEQTAAFGNGDNDAEMLAWAGWGAAVAEATEACKASADHVTGSYDDSGVARALEMVLGE